ncbi:MAG: hypothetical protein CVV44_22000 [Spirochaetae bacterium HGW-Spirochaetae-1]|nr:MAG: hypothetical protein CVV44_22000 [Spirochaetae bacterium HGW-Spirochaetae-1]
MENRLSKRVLDVLEWPLIVEEIASRCATTTGRALTGTLSPLEHEPARRQMRKISDLKELAILGRFPDFSGIVEIGPLVVRAEKQAVLRLDELMDIRKFAGASHRIKHFLQEHREAFPALDEEYTALQDLAPLAKILEASITDDAELSPEQYPVLKRIRRDIRITRDDIEKTLNKVLHSPSAEHVIQEKIITSVGQRYVILIKSNMKGKMGGTVQDVSSSGATLYLEPDAVRPLNDRIIMLERELEYEILAILTDLSHHVGSRATELYRNIEVLAYIDFINAASRFSTAIRGAAPVIPDEPVIELFGARHPLLYLMQPDTTVANDISIGGAFTCLIISGANTGGKTVILKTTGIAVLLVMMGLHVPASADSRIGIFADIMADIGDDQNLQQSLSTYSGQITIINEMIRRGGPGTLVLIDEIIVGTNPRQGAALAQAILEEMVKNGSRIIVTTHYTELKELASSDSAFRNASVSFDLETLRPTYRLIMGLPGISYAIEIARNYGLAESILERSKSLIDDRDISMEALLEETQRYRGEMEEERMNLDRLRDEALREKGKIAAREQELRELTRDVKKAQGLEFLEELKKYRRLIAEKITGLQGAGIKEAGELQQEIIALQDGISSRLQKEIRETAAAEYEPASPDTLSPGDRVFIASLEKEAVVESVDAAGESAVVLLGNAIRSRFRLTDLYRSGTATGASKSRETRAEQKKRRNEMESQSIPFTMQTQYNTIDLRGKRADEALAVMNSELDRMDRNNMGTVIIIHGHGTGALKHAVREHLKYSIYVSDFRSGDNGEGGDGVTVAQLRQ